MSNFIEFDSLFEEALGINLSEGIFFKKKKHEEKPSDAELEKEVDNLIIKVKNYIAKPHTLGNGYDAGILALLVKAGYDNQKIASLIKKNPNGFKKGKISDLYSDKEKINNFKNKFGTMDFLIVLENDDYTLGFIPSKNIFFEDDGGIKDFTFSYDRFSYAVDLYDSQIEQFVKKMK